MASRPRRSTASVVSYAIPALELSSDSSGSGSAAEGASSADEEEDVKPVIASTSKLDTSPPKRRGRPPKNGVSAQPRSEPKTTPKSATKGKGKGKAKGRGRRKASSDDSGSDFAEELANKSASSEESEEFVDEAASEDDEGGGARDDEYDDDIVLSEDGSQSTSTRRKAPQGLQSFTPRPGKRPGARGRLRDNKEAQAKLNYLPTSSASANNDGAILNPRAMAPPPSYRSLSDPELVAFGPLFEPPFRRWDAKKGEMLQGRAWSWKEREELMQGWGETAFFLREDGFADLGWCKGKWDVEGGSINKRWGGWYDVKERGIELVDEGAVTPYLPRNVYPTRPTRIFSDAPPQPNKAGNGEAEAEDEDGEPPAVEEEDAMQVDGEEDGEGEDDEQDEGDTNQVKILLGLIDNIEGIDMGPQREVTFDRFESKRLDEFVPRKPGHLLNAGGPVTALAWAPRADGRTPVEHLAIGTVSAPLTIAHSPSPSPALIQIWSLDCTSPSDSARETAEDEVERGKGMKLEVALCIEVGEPLELAWCPRGGKQTDARAEDGLGLIAGAFADGSVSLFDVPTPAQVREKTGGKKAGQENGKALFVKAQPRLRLALPHTSALCVDWASHETLAAGCTDGTVVVWDVGQALRTNAPSCRPIQVVPLVHCTAIRSLSWILVPPLSADLSPSQDPEAEPHSLVTVGMDGSGRLLNLNDSGSIIILWQERGPGICSAFSAQTGTVLTNDSEHIIRAHFLKPDSFASSKVISMHRGQPWSVAASDHHPFAAIGAADGGVQVSNMIRSLRQKSHRVKFAQKLFKVDFNRLTGQYKMMDNLLPEQRTTTDVSKKKRKGAAKDGEVKGFEDARISGAWSPEVGVLRVAWCGQAESARLLASGMACGLVRIDWVDCGRSA